MTPWCTLKAASINTNNICSNIMETWDHVYNNFSSITSHHTVYRLDATISFSVPYTETIPHILLSPGKLLLLSWKGFHYALLCYHFNTTNPFGTVQMVGEWPEWAYWSPTLAMEISFMMEKQRFRQEKKAVLLMVGLLGCSHHKPLAQLALIGSLAGSLSESPRRELTIKTPTCPLVWGQGSFCRAYRSQFVTAIGGCLHCSTALIRKCQSLDWLFKNLL